MSCPFPGVSSRLAAWFGSQDLSHLRFASGMFTDAELASGEATVLIGAELRISDQDDFEKLDQEVRVAFRQARALAERASAQFARRPTWAISSEQAVKKMRADEEAIERRLQAQSWTSKRATTPPPAASPRYGTARRAKVVGAGSIEGRAVAERAERERWVKELVDMLKAMSAPCIVAAEASADPQRVIKLLVGGRRVSTLRARIREWRQASQWLKGTSGTPFFATATSLVDYLCTRFDQGGTKSVIRSAFAAVRFVEDLLDLPISERPSQQSLVTNALKELEAQAAARRDGRGRQQAHPPPTEAIRMIERLIIDPAAASYDRLIGWWACTSVWASLRFDDHRGLVPGSITETSDHFHFTMSRTKTTGPDKIHSLRPGVVSKCAWLECPSWFAVGWKLWQSLAPYGRDYFLCPPKPGGGCDHRELRYVEYSSRLRSMLASLEDQDGVQLGMDWAMFLTPHSFRAFLPSALEAVGAPSNLLNWLLSWKTPGGAGYARTGKTKTLMMQRTIANILKANLGGADPVGEVTLIEHLTKHLETRGASEEERGRVTRALSAFSDQPVREVLWAAEAPKPHDTTSTTDSTTVPIQRGSSNDPKPATELDRSTAEPQEGSEGHIALNESATGSIAVDSSNDPKPATELDWSTAEPHEVPEGYVISISAKKRLRRLHLMGACHMLPGLDYSNYIVVGDKCPGNDQYDDYCRHCWRGDAQPKPEDTASGDSQYSVGSATESSSTESDA